MPYEVYNKNFITPEKYSDLVKKSELNGPNGWLLFVSCNSGIDFAHAVKDEYEKMLKESGSKLASIPMIGSKEDPITRVFSDSETCPRLPRHVAGSNVYVFQSAQENISGNSVNENIQQLLQVVRTLRSHRAQHITVVTPYCPYSRQDKPTYMKRESALSSLIADQLRIAGADIHLTYHPHTLSLYGFYEPDIQFVALSGLDLFVEIFKDKRDKDNVVAVSTDAGGAKFIIHYAEAMGVAYAIANKYRRGKDESSLLGVIGDLENKKVAIIADDETVTGSSIINTAETLHKKYKIDEIYVAVSHLKIKKEFIPKFIKAHKEYGLKELHFTNTIPQIPEVFELDFAKQHSLAEMFAATINRLHYNQSVSSIFSNFKKSK